VLGPREALENLLERSGLLTVRGNRKLGFYHFSIQEFLAAERIFDLQLEDLKSVFTDRAPVAGWRNTLSFLFGRYTAAFTVASRPLALLNKLVDVLDDEAYGLQRVVVDCAEMLVAKGYALEPTGPGRLRQRLLHAMTTRTKASERCEAGTLLGRIGDVRFDPAMWFLPTESGAPLAFLRVDAGSFLIGSNATRDPQAYKDEQPQHSLQLPEFFIARYPVTVAQFRAFSESSGFVPEDVRSLQGIANHPVVLVSWHESLKYCRWLTETLRRWVNVLKRSRRGLTRRFEMAIR
jgi:Sulfatase-modifying factor enzyme 1